MLYRNASEYSEDTALCKGKVVKNHPEMVSKLEQIKKGT